MKAAPQLVAHKLISLQVMIQMHWPDLRDGLTLDQTDPNTQTINTACMTQFT